MFFYLFVLVWLFLTLLSLVLLILVKSFWLIINCCTFSFISNGLIVFLLIYFIILILQIHIIFRLFVLKMFLTFSSSRFNFPKIGFLCLLSYFFSYVIILFFMLYGRKFTFYIIAFVFIHFRKLIQFIDEWLVFGWTYLWKISKLIKIIIVKS